MNTNTDSTKKISGSKKPALILAGCLTAALLTGCLQRSSGGEETVKGYDLLEEENYSDALETFQSAVEAHEDEVPAYRGEGIALIGLARYAEAAEAFSKALSYTDRKMDKTRYDILKYQASACLRSGDYSGTVTTCTTLLDMKEDADVCYYLGAAYLGLGDQDQAKKNFDRAVALDEGSYALYLHIYECYADYDLTADGDSYLKTAESIQPESDDDYYQLGQIYYYLEQYDEAKNALAPAAENGYTPAMELMGEVYLAQEDYDHALSMFQSLMDLKGESPAAYNGLALCSIASGNYDGALAYIEEGLKLDTDESKQNLRFDEIVCYEKKLDFETAAIKARAYVELYPTDEAGQREYRFLKTRVSSSGGSETSAEQTAGEPASAETSADTASETGMTSGDTASAAQQ